MATSITKFASRTWDGVKYQLEYIGTTSASAGTAPGIYDDPIWVIRRIYRVSNPDNSYSISEIRTQTAVAWTARASLPW